MGPQPTKPVIKPKCKMKALHWKRVILEPSKHQKTVWSEMPDAPLPFDSSEFEALFAQNVKQKNIANRRKLRRLMTR